MDPRVTSFEEYENIDSWVHKAVKIPIARTCSWAAWETHIRLCSHHFKTA